MATSTTFVRGRTKFEDFDPNKAFSDKPLYGIFDGQRFRTYSQRGHAINAFHASYQGRIYMQGAAGWVLLGTKHEMLVPDVCDGCNQPVKASWSGTWNSSKQWQFRHDPNGKIADPLVLLRVCATCHPHVRFGGV